MKLNNLKSALKNSTEVSLRLSLYMIDSSNNETNFPHKLIITDRQIARFR